MEEQTQEKLTLIGQENSDEINLTTRVLNELRRLRERVVNGLVNSIASPFKRFERDFIGIQQHRYYVVTASTKIGKTQLASYLFLYTPIFYAIEHPDKVRLKIFYYALEETANDVMLRFMSHLLYKFDNISISTDGLQSVREGKLLDLRILELLDSEKYRKYLDFFSSHVEFSESTNPTGVLKECEKYALDNGQVFYKNKVIKDDLGNNKTIKKFDYYVPNDPEEYKIIFYDHVSLTSTERGMSLKESIDKLSEYFVTLRNKYNYSPVVVQQQAFAGESLDAIKEQKLKPTIANLADSKYTARDKPKICIFVLFIYNLLLSLHSKKYRYA